MRWIIRNISNWWIIHWIMGYSNRRSVVPSQEMLWEKEMIVQLREKDYTIKLPNQIRSGTEIIVNDHAYTFLAWQQCKDMGTQRFGEYGKMKVADLKSNEIKELQAYEFSPIICVEHTT